MRKNRQKKTAQLKKKIRSNFSLYGIIGIMNDKAQKTALQRLLSTMRNAAQKFNMIANGDKIAVGLSGGKDSLALLSAMAAYRLFAPQRFELAAVTVDMGFKGMDLAPLTAFCKDLGVPYTIVKTDIAEVIFDIRKESNPCSLCSKMRRGALNTEIVKQGYGKLALAHHADDMAETMLLSLLYEGRLSTFMPVSYLDRTGVTVIRPFIYTPEKDIKAYSKYVPVVKNPCPADKHTQREYMKELIKTIQKDIPFAKERILTAIDNSLLK